MSSPLPPDLRELDSEPTLNREINNVVVIISNSDGSTIQTGLSYYLIKDRKVELVKIINKFAKELFDKYWSNDSDPYNKYHNLPIDDNLRLEISFARPPEYYSTPSPTV